MIAVFTAPERISTPTTTTNTWNSNRRIGGPARCIASPPSRLSTYSIRTLSGMIIPANSVMTPVQTTAYMQTILPVIRRFFNFGEAISR